MKRRFALPVALAVVIGAASAHAAGPLERNVPAGGGLDAVDVKIDVATGVVRVRRAGHEKTLPIAVEKSRIDAAASSVEIVPVGGGRSIAHVRVVDVQRKDLAFEALFSGQSDDPIFAGLTGYTHGEEGDRSGQQVLVRDRDGQNKFVIVAEKREDTRICGQTETPLGAQGVDPSRMQLVGATLPRIDKAAREGAQRVIAQVRTNPAPPLARVLLATGGSSPNAPALTDGKTDTFWSEGRSGDGHGEFATMRAPTDLPIYGLVVTITPPKPKADGAAPHSFFVAMDDRLLLVTMPEDAWQKPGQAYDIPLPQPVRTGCVAVVLEDAYTRNVAAPEVTIAEIGATTKFDLDGAKLADVARALSTTPNAKATPEEAASLLRRAGPEGLAAVVSEYATLDARGRALAIDVAASTSACDGPGAELLTRALGDKETEVRKRALGRIERCGKAAAPALVLAVRGDDEITRAAAAPLLATVAASLAIEPLAEQMGRGAPETRRAVRGAFARASAGATRDKLLGLLTKKDLSSAARLDLLRALGPKLPELRPEADVALLELLRGSPDMPTRYLLAQPLAHLARSPDATSGELTRMAELARHDPEWAVRARAVELSAGVAPLAATVLGAVADPEPRVREAALKAIAAAGGVGSIPPAAQALAKDDWTFVRMAAADALGVVTQDVSATNALAVGLADTSPKVRFTVIAALGRQRATSQAARVRERLDDPREDPEVRAIAARALGAMCVQNAADRLTKLALLSRSPVDEADERIGMAAVEALGALHPADLEARLAPLRGKDVRLPVRHAADRALSEPSSCR